MGSHLLAHFGCGIDLVGSLHTNKEQITQVVYHLAGKLARVTAFIQRFVDLFQPGCGLLG
jgi:hypothetical protein